VNRTRCTIETDGRALVTTPRGVVVGQERVEEEVTQITQWFTRLPRGDRRGGDPLGIGFGGGEHIRNPLGFLSVVARVGEGGAIA
jgi:hypothetical protein